MPLSLVILKNTEMKLRLKNTVIIGFAFLSIMILWQGYNWFVPLYLDAQLEALFTEWMGDAGLAKFMVGAIMGLDNLFALFMIPIVSKLSDKTDTKLGKRVPFIIVGISVAMIAFGAVPFVAQTNIIVLAIVLLVIMVAMNFYRSPAVALMPDITPKPLRARGNAIINIMGGVGTGLGYVICYLCSEKIFNTGNVVPMEIIALVMFVCLVMVVLFVKEKSFKQQMLDDVNAYCKETGDDPEDYIGQSDEEEENAAPEKEIATKLDKRNLFLMLGSILFYYMASNSIETFMSIYSEDVLGSQSHGLEMLAALAVGNFAFMIPSAMFAEKIGRRNAMLIGSGLMFLANVSMIFVTEFTYLIAVPFFIFGIGMSIMITNMYPTIVSFCSKGDYARFTGYYYTSTMIAQSITPALAGLLMSPYFGGSTNRLMPYAAVFSCLCFVALMFVSRNDKSDKPAKSKKVKRG